MIDKKRLELLCSTAESMGLKPQVLGNYGLVSVQIGGKEQYLFHKASNPNDQLASWVARDKLASRLVLEKHELPNIPFCLPSSSAEAQSFLAKHSRIIAKPLKGEKSQGIHLITNEAELDKLDVSDCILEKFVKAQEVRYLVVASEVKAVHYKMYEADINDPNVVERVSLPKEEWDEHLTKTAVKAAEALGLIFTAVDFMVTDAGEAYILEVNSAPGIDRFQEPDQGPAIDMMQLYLEQLVKNYSK